MLGKQLKLFFSCEVVWNQLLNLKYLMKPLMRTIGTPQLRVVLLLYLSFQTFSIIVLGYIYIYFEVTYILICNLLTCCCRHLLDLGILGSE